MIPTCNRLTFLKETIQSVLSQAPSASKMEICIVDNSTDPINWKAFLSLDELRRVTIYRPPTFLSMYQNINYCIELAKGELIHLLHDDDFILEGFYDEIESLAYMYPQLSLYATRCYYVDNHSQIIGETPHLFHLEGPSHDPQDLFVDNHVQFAGTVVRSQFYSENGGFNLSLKYCPDWEMWIKAISIGGAVASPKILASYRLHSNSGSNTSEQTAENLEEREALCQQMAKQYSNYPIEKADQRILTLAHIQEDYFWDNGDYQAAIRNAAFWYRRASLKEKLNWQLNRAVNKAKRLLFR
jgi:glycosyltransferase involved in cell wall biosynthesis